VKPSSYRLCFQKTSATFFLFPHFYHQHLIGPEPGRSSSSPTTLTPLPCPAHQTSNHPGLNLPSHQDHPYSLRPPQITTQTPPPQPTLHAQTPPLILRQGFGHPKLLFLFSSQQILSNQPSMRDFPENLFCPPTMIHMNTMTPPPLPCPSPHHTRPKSPPNSPPPGHRQKYGNTGISVFVIVYTGKTYGFWNRHEVHHRNTEIQVFPYFRYFRKSAPKNP